MEVILFASFVVLLLAGVPISFALIIAAWAAIVGGTSFSTDIIIQKLFNGSNSFPLVAIPLFIFAGGIMSRGAMAQRLVALARLAVGNARGGIGMVSVLACMLFAALSGSTAATTAAIGTILIPAMQQGGFSRGSATALQATAGSLGVIIPPSIPCILMGVIGGISIGELFLAGIVPGVLIGGSLMLVSFLVARGRTAGPPAPRPSLRECWRIVRDSLLALVTVVWVLGGIVAGIVTPTEAAIVAVLYALLIELAYYRELKLSALRAVLVDTVKITGIVVLCIGAAAPFAWLMIVGHIPDRAAALILSVSANPVFLKLSLLVILLVVGTFLDLTPAMLLLVPIVQPIAYQVGLSPVQFGIFVVAALAVGQVTPPVGISLFVASSISKAKMEEVAVPMLPFLAAMVLVIALILFVPPLAEWIPHLVMQR